MAKDAPTTHYDILGVADNATKDQIDHAFRRLARTAHPNRGGNAGLFRLINQAHEVLTDEVRRRDYDAQLSAGPGDEPDPSVETHKAPTTPRPPSRLPRGLSPSTPTTGAVYWTVPRAHDSRGRARLRVSWVLLALAALSIGAAVLEAFLFLLREELRDISDWINLVLGWIVLLGLGGAVAVGLGVLAWKVRPGPLASKVLPSEVLDTRVFGTPGSGMSTARFGDRAAPGRAGEDRTAAIIEDVLLPLLPGARVIHGLRWPGSDHDDIDHAVVAGSRLLLVDSKWWLPGEYWNDGKTAVYRWGEHVHDLRVGEAARAVRMMLNKQSTEFDPEFEVPPSWSFEEANSPYPVRARVLVHTRENDAGSPLFERPPSTFRPNYDPDLAYPCNAEEFVEDALEFLLPQGDVVDVEFLRDVLALRLQR